MQIGPIFISKEFLFKQIIPKFIFGIIIIAILYGNFVRTQVYVLCKEKYIYEQTNLSIKTMDLSSFGFVCIVGYQNGKNYEYNLKDLKNLKKNHGGKQE